MANTPKAALPYPASSDAPNGPSQIQALATALDTKVIIPVANQAARDALGTTGNLLVQRLDTGNIESNFGGSWSWVAGPLISGKAWRTGGAGPAITANAPTTVGLDAARLTGGVVFNSTNDTLSIPQSGFYDLRCKGYATGSTNYTHSWRIVRTRSATADKEIVGSSLGRKPDALDEVQYGTDTLPLQAGDTIYLRCYFSGAGTYYGIDEVSGVYLSLRYVGPLAGATPV